MLDRQTSPLEIAETVLRPATIRKIRRSDLSDSAYKILDRWALNDPDKLRRMEQDGITGLMQLADEQHRKEADVLNSESAQWARSNGWRNFDILQAAEVW
jgi:hypothetical protein